MRRTRLHLIAGTCAAFALSAAALTANLAAAAAPRGPRPSTSTHAARHSGDVTVLSAGSLDTVMTKVIGPAFHRSTGYTLVDTSGGSTSLAADIKNKVDVADVFVSASAAVNSTLRGKKNGNWVSWYASFAASPEVLGYYPKSRFAHDLKTKPWYDVITLPGFRLGRTDPSQDPGGVLARKALLLTAKAKQLPALRKLATESSDEYSENTEQAGIQNGQLDASFMYEAGANSQKSPFVKLTGVKLAGDYTVTIVRGAPHHAAAEAFIRFLLGPRGRAAMRADHFAIVSPPKLTGSGVPAALRHMLN